MVPRRQVRESAGVHIRHAMQLLTRLEALAPTDEAREDFRVANQRLWLAFQESNPVRPPRRRGRWAAVLALLGVAAAGAFVFVMRGGAGQPDPSDGPTSAAVSTPLAAQAAPAPAAAATGPAPAAQPTLFDQLGESLWAALQNYQDRFDLFQRQQMDCAGLESAFVAVNERWVAYSVERKRLTTPLDPARASADHSFYAAVDTAENHQERSGCPRP